MPTKWNVDELTPGRTVEATFCRTPPRIGSLAPRLDGRRAPRSCSRTTIASSPACRVVRVVAVHKPERDDRGRIEVEFVAHVWSTIFRVYLDPVVSKKLQVLLQSGLNILLDGPQGCGKTVLARSIADSLGMVFVFFNCGAVVEASDFLVSIQVRASASGAPVTDFIKTDVLIALEEAGDTPTGATSCSRRAEPLPGERAQRADARARRDPPRVPSDREHVHPDPGQRVVHRGGQPRPRVHRNVRHRRRSSTARAAADGPAAESQTEILARRHPTVSATNLEIIVAVADAIRHAADLTGSLSVRATDEACTYLAHPLFADDGKRGLPEILKSSFCGRFPGRWDDVTTDAGAVWALVRKTLTSYKVQVPDDAPMKSVTANTV
jgi:nitric oxide reductase NorQ protein